MESKNWTSDKLENLCDIILGRTPSRNKNEYWGKGIDWVSISDMKQKLIFSTKEQITVIGAEKSRSRLIKKGTLLMSFKLSIGKLAFAGKDLYTNEAIAALPIKDNNKINNEYLYYLLQNIPLIGGNQAVMGKTLNKTSLQKLQIPYPKSIEKQKRIAQVLSDCEDLIAKRKESIALLDDLVKSTFLEMFGDPVRNVKNFELVPLATLGTIDRGVSKHRPRNAPELLGGVHPLIQTGDVSNSNTYITSFSSTYSDLGLKQSKKWPIGTLCITIAANIAKTSILSFEACFPDSVVGFIVNKESNNLYVHHLFSFFQRILETNAPAAAQKNINLKILRNLKVPKPPRKLQTEFAGKISEIEELKNLYQFHLLELNNFYNRLSQDAFKRELDLDRIELKTTEINTNFSFDIDEVKISVEKPSKNNISKKKLAEIIFSSFGKNDFSIDTLRSLISEKYEKQSTEELKSLLKDLLESNQIEQTYNQKEKQIKFRVANEA
ncbi:restriction endonuclease subunit S [Salinimicrobium flavum]|uniref:Restriction endonuclease subunit S n=1 Tax=Salinimicrobium flavum TaxID=1737065 RepID=A0ABW5IYW5_9FLAO